MITVDTNILVRILIQDDKEIEQTKLAKRFAEKYKQLFIPQIVQAELVWVLEFIYKFSKQEILSALNHICENEAFVLQHSSQFEEALKLFNHSSADFSDCLILATSNHENHSVVTFDKKFSKLPKVELLT